MHPGVLRRADQWLLYFLVYPHLPAQSESIHALTEDTLVSDHTDLQFLSLVPKQRPLVPLVQLLTGQRLSQDLPGVKGQKWTRLQMQWICSKCSIWIYLYVYVVTWRGLFFFSETQVSFSHFK